MTRKTTRLQLAEKHMPPRLDPVADLLRWMTTEELDRLHRAYDEAAGLPPHHTVDVTETLARVASASADALARLDAVRSELHALAAERRDRGDPPTDRNAERIERRRKAIREAATRDAAGERTRETTREPAGDVTTPTPAEPVMDARARLRLLRGDDA